jgi:hypothetical protein
MKRCVGKNGETVSGYTSTLKSNLGLAEKLQALNQEAVQIYTPVVESILDCNTCDVRHIERTLDGLLSFCGHEPALLLYRRLCRHYFAIDPVATAGYVHAYRDMWDPEQEEAQSSSVKKHLREPALKAKELEQPKKKKPLKKSEAVK